MAFPYCQVNHKESYRNGIRINSAAEVDFVTLKREKH